MREPTIREIRKTVESVMRTYDGFKYSTMGPNGPIATFDTGRKIKIDIEEIMPTAVSSNAPPTKETP